MQQILQCGRYRFSLDRACNRPLVMGVLNVTPDSFSDGGQFQSMGSALSRAEQMIAEGVDIIDIGGESSRPGAPPVSLDEELHRVMPVLHALHDCGKPLSIDTYKPQVMRAAIEAGADMINDIYGFRADGALAAVKDGNCALCIMHMQSEPQTMQLNPEYDDVVDNVTGFLRTRLEKMREAGIAPNRLCVDPGFGFGKSMAHNLALLKNLGYMQSALDAPMLAGLSRKSLIGTITGRPVGDRLPGSLAAALAAVAKGVCILRVHDVAATVDALNVWRAATQ
jgi:dihydropteroate synthase